MLTPACRFRYTLVSIQLTRLAFNDGNFPEKKPKKQNAVPKAGYQADDDLSRLFPRVLRL